MQRYETVLSLSGKSSKSPTLMQSVQSVLTSLGLAMVVLMVGSTAIVLSNSEMRSRVFFSAPVQAAFATEFNLLSQRVASGATRLASEFKDNRHGVATHPVKFNSLDTSKPLTAGQRRVTSFLAKRYRVSPEAIESLVRLAYKVGKDEKVEPTLILAIVGIESSYNPFAASQVGARGLMQVMPALHQDKFEKLSPGDWSALNPEMNMRVGAKIIREYTRRTGSVNTGLRWYVGAAIHGNDGGYPSKVLSLKARIDSVYQNGQVLISQGKAQNVSVASAVVIKG